MKFNKTFAMLSVAILAFAFSFSLVLAEENDNSDSKSNRDEVRVQTTSGDQAKPTLYTSQKDDERNRENGREGTSTLRSKDDGEDDSDLNETSKDDESDEAKEGENDGDRHERVMNKVNKKLEKLSREIPGLGDEIREIARNEASSTEDRVAAIHEIQQQSFISRIIFGADRSKLNSLSDELKTTQASIDRLNLAKSQIASSTLQAQIDVQIKSLETARASAESFIKNNESSFSIFGFFSKIFGGK